ncbi:MAG: hypothetical protein GY869_31830, partial [Planctomycetes bacterium]|nr:hypothetical protein [Planctomycetota bacterium]
MAEQADRDYPVESGRWWDGFLFLRIFRGFRMAIQPGKLILGMLAVLTLFVGGWVMDQLTPESKRVIVRDGVSELEFYTSRVAAGERLDWEDQRHQMLESNDADLMAMYGSSPIMRTDLNELRDKNPLPTWRGKVKDEIGDDHEKLAGEVLGILERQYQELTKEVEGRYDDMAAPADRNEAATRKEQEKEELAELRDAYAGLYVAILEGGGEDGDVSGWQDTLDVDGELVSDTIAYVRCRAVAEAAYGRGVFETIVDFKFEQLEGAVRALVLRRDFVEVKDRVYQVLLMVGWACRFHPVYMIFLAVLCLVIWSLFGGGICRIAALQSARDERIGAWRALQFSSAKFASFFSAPLIPLGVIALIGFLIFVGGAVGAIPYVGEIMAGIFIVLTLFGGFVIALMVLGLTGGLFLMHPTIAVEGSDSFDAISRSFSYVFARPWRMLFYTVIGVIYGAICFLFVRLFVFLLLMASYFPMGLIMNYDHASVSFRGKLEAIWTEPTFSNLQVGFWDIHWLSLNTTETIGALFIWIGVTVAAATVIGFVVSFFFSMNTIIYYLLRKHVDSTDLEDVYLEQDTEELYQGATEELGE